MSTPSPQLPEVKAGAQYPAESLERQVQSIDLNGSQSNITSQEPIKPKLSAVRSNEFLQTMSSSLIQYIQRDLLEILNGRRLDITRIKFTADGTPAGRGGHAEVVVATLILDDGTAVESANKIAVKRFLLGEDIDEEKFLRTFANELHVLDRLDHSNVVKLVGFVEDMKKRMAWLVFPWEGNGNVREFLLSGQWELPERVSLIKDVASGLEYLHSRQPPVRHGDLKSLNILVNSEHRAVITDFGSARIQSEARGFETTGVSPRRQNPNVASDDQGSEVTVSAANGELTLTGPSWSFRWAAPEILNGEEPCLASDIWALGWIAWEVITDNYPFPEAKSDGSITINVIMRRLPKLDEDGQLSQLGELCFVMVRCWNHEPNGRLSAAECKKALRFIPSAVPGIRSDGTSQVRSAALLMEMGDMHRFQSRYKAALQFFEEGLAIARSTRDTATTARALYMAAHSHLMMSNHKKAEECCREALDIYTTIGYIPGRANAFQRLGEIHRHRSDVPQAEECYNEALAACTIVGDRLGQANALWALGIVQYRHPDKAEESFNQALAIYTSIEDSLGQANVLRRLGESSQEQSDYAKAEEFFTKALALYTNIGGDLGRASTLQGLGSIHQRRSEYTKAEELYRQSLDIHTSIGYSVGQAGSALGLGEVLILQERYSEAKPLLNFAAQVFGKFKHVLGQLQSEVLLAGIVEAEKQSTSPPP